MSGQYKHPPKKTKKKQQQQNKHVPSKRFMTSGRFIFVLYGLLRLYLVRPEKQDVSSIWCETPKHTVFNKRNILNQTKAQINRRDWLPDFSDRFSLAVS